MKNKIGILPTALGALNLAGATINVKNSVGAYAKGGLVSNKGNILNSIANSVGEGTYCRLEQSKTISEFGSIIIGLIVFSKLIALIVSIRSSTFTIVLPSIFSICVAIFLVFICHLLTEGKYICIINTLISHFIHDIFHDKDAESTNWSIFSRQGNIRLGCFRWIKCSSLI